MNRNGTRPSTLEVIRLREENTRLKELNRELIVAMKLNCTTCWENGGEACQECVCSQVLAKAEGQGE